MDSLSADQALERLQQGNQRFRNERMTGTDRDATRRGELVHGQRPFAAILSCADSRVSPEIVFDTGLGELFVVRVAGNVATTSSIASIEFAVGVLETRLVVVIAHEGCGAVGAALAGDAASDNLDHLLAHIRPAISATAGSDVDAVARRNARHAAERLAAESDIIRGAMEKEGVRIVTAFYHLVSGEVEFE